MWCNAPAERAAWAGQARAVRIEDELARRGIKLRGGVDRFGPCPACGGTDRFSINVKKQVWICRKCPAGGDVIALVQHLDGIGYIDAIAHLAGAATRHLSRFLRHLSRGLQTAKLTKFFCPPFSPGARPVPRMARSCFVIAGSGFYNRSSPL